MTNWGKNAEKNNIKVGAASMHSTEIGVLQAVYLKYRNSRTMTKILKKCFWMGSFLVKLKACRLAAALKRNSFEGIFLRILTVSVEHIICWTPLKDCPVREKEKCNYLLPLSKVSYPTYLVHQLLRNHLFPIPMRTYYHWVSFFCKSLWLDRSLSLSLSASNNS